MLVPLEVAELYTRCESISSVTFSAPAIDAPVIRIIAFLRNQGIINANAIQWKLEQIEQIYDGKERAHVFL